MSLTEAIIKCVKTRPLLYDSKHQDYKDLRKRDREWQAIGEEINHDGDEVKKKWRNIKDCYIKHLRAVSLKESKVKRSYRNWQWWRQMEFYKPHLDLTAITDQSENTAVRNLSNKRKLSSSEDPAPTIISTYYPNNAHTAKQTIPQLKVTDATDMIFLGYSNTIKTFTPKRQAIVKMRIAQIIMEEEINNLEGPSNPSSCQLEDTTLHDSHSDLTLSVKLEEPDLY